MGEFNGKVLIFKQKRFQIRLHICIFLYPKFNFHGAIVIGRHRAINLCFVRVGMGDGIQQDGIQRERFLVACYATLYVTMSVGRCVCRSVTTQFVIEFLIVFDRFFCEILFGQYFFLEKFFFFLKSFFLSFLSFFVIFYAFTFYCPCPATRDQGSRVYGLVFM